ncbi:MAG: ester cyclase [Dehalococcoidia bacterium]|nr:ester cyclase [Dehalococcoidia bacterium]
MQVSNVDLVRNTLGALNSRQFHRIPEFIAPGFVRHDLAGAYPGVAGTEGVADLLSALLNGSPDLQVVIQDIFADGDRVAARVTVEGTHTGELFGLPGSGRRFAVNELLFYRVENGRIAETWQLLDLAGLKSQLAN